MRESLKRRRLANGVQIFVLPEPTVPTLAFHTTWRVGSRNERPGITGISHLFEHLMFNGARKYGPKEFDRALESNGGSSNAYTSRDVTAYFETVPCDKLDLVLDLELDRFRHVDLSESSLRAELEVVKGERRHHVDEYPAGDLDEQLHAAAFQAHPYRWPVIGWPADLDAIGVPELEDYFRTHYCARNATVAVAGAIDAEAALDAVEAAYGLLEEGPVQPPVVRSEPEQRGERRVVLRREAQLPVLALGYHAPPASSPELPALEILQAILSDGDSSRLQRRLVLEDELAVDVGFGFPWALDPTLLTVDLTLRRGVEAARAEAVVDEVLGSLVSKPPDEKEMQKARNVIEAYHWRQLKTNEGRADVLCRCAVLLGDAEAFFDMPQRYAEVTADDVAALAAGLFRRDGRTVALLEPLTGAGS
jgi:zinc protease